MEEQQIHILHWNAPDYKDSTLSGVYLGYCLPLLPARSAARAEDLLYCGYLRLLGAQCLYSFGIADGRSARKSILLCRNSNPRALLLLLERIVRIAGIPIGIQHPNHTIRELRMEWLAPRFHDSDLSEALSRATAQFAYRIPSWDGNACGYRPGSDPDTSPSGPYT